MRPSKAPPHFAFLAALACFTLAGPLSAAADESPANAITPVGEPIVLFNGRDLTGLSTWLEDSGHEDPRGVFSVEDGVLRLSGDGNGGVTTDKAYRDYRLVVEYKWGEKTYGSKTVRNSGVLLHGVGKDGNAGAWLSSIECQLAQGCVGDLIVIRGKREDGAEIPVTVTSDTVLGSDGRTRWKKGGGPTEYSGKQFWWSLHDPDFKEEIDTRGRDDVESPLGDWTKVECACAKDRITIAVNDVVVNECYRANPSAGRITLQTEGFEILFRKFELHPLEPQKKE